MRCSSVAGIGSGPEEIRLHFCPFRGGKNKGCAPSSLRARRSFAPHFILRISSMKTIPNKNTTRWVVFLFGGPEEIRTPDPYNANVMRSQLRYGPVCFVLYAVWGGLSRIKCDRETWRGLPQNERKMPKFFVSFFRNIRLKRRFAVWYNTKC